MNKRKLLSLDLNIDTEAINELYTYGGEGGEKKRQDLNEQEIFE